MLRLRQRFIPKEFVGKRFVDKTLSILVDDNGPYFIMPATAGMIGTYCGLRINDKAQVIGVFGEVIPGLLAAGEATGGVHGAAYMTGTAFGKALAYGRIAARTVAS